MMSLNLSLTFQVLGFEHGIDFILVFPLILSVITSCKQERQNGPL